jgi:hypothetical protein
MSERKSTSRQVPHPTDPFQPLWETVIKVGDKTISKGLDYNQEKSQEKASERADEYDSDEAEDNADDDE